MPTQNIFDLVDTWNDGATTFTAVKMNVTDTASNSASLLMDIGTGGGTYVSKFKVQKNGAVTFSNGTIISDAGGVDFATNAVFRSGSISFGASSDAIVGRRGAANLRFGSTDAAAPVAQTLSVQSVVAGTTNTAGANLTITGSQGTGTGAGGSIIFQVAAAGSSGSAQNALAAALTINSDRTVTFASGIIGSTILLGVGGNLRTTNVSTPGNTVNMFMFENTGNTGNLVYADATTSPLFRFAGTTSSFPAIKRSSTTLQARLADDSAFASVQGKLTTETAYTAGAPTATGYLVVYDSNGTAYRIPAVLN